MRRFGRLVKVFFGCQKQSEFFRMIPFCRFMMDLMCPPDTQQIAVTGFKTLQPVVYKPVMEYKINYSINCYTNTDPEFNIQICPSHPYKIQRDCGKKQAENIIELKPSGPMLMVASVNKPKRTMKQILMHKP